LCIFGQVLGFWDAADFWQDETKYGANSKMIKCQGVDYAGYAVRFASQVDGSIRAGRDRSAG
jgi:hypothetical protein